MSGQPTPDLSEFIAENFGANATYVESLLQRFRSDPALVDDSWRAYFNELLGGPQAAGNGGATATATRGDAGDGAAATTARSASEQRPAQSATQQAAWPTTHQATTTAQPSTASQQSSQTAPAQGVAAAAQPAAAPV